MKYEEAIEYQSLLAALKRCVRGTLWKESTAGYWLNRLKNTYKLRREILAGKYRISIYLWFTVTEPKLREIYASYIKDRQYQHALIDNIVYPSVTKLFVPGNCACQKGRGTNYCIDYFVRHLREYARRNGNNGYVLQCDVKSFFPSTNHDVSCANIQKYVDDRTAAACSDVIRSFSEIEFAKILIKTGLNKKTAHAVGHRVSSYMLYGGNWKRAVNGLTDEQIKVIQERIQQGNFSGVGLGSQVTQMTQITLLNELDHYITENLKVKIYVRYMDDFILVHESKEHLRYCKERITDFLAELKLKLNPKTQLYPLKRGIILLHWRIRIGVTGKVVIHKHKVKINRERRKLRKQKKMLDAGRLTLQDIETSFQCWQAGIIKQGCYMQAIRMRRLYWQLFGRRAPEWNRKFRTSKKREEIILSSISEATPWECCVNGMIPQ